MKLIYISMNISRLNPFLEVLEKHDFKSYQILENVTGKQFTGSPRMNTAVWPGYNSAIFLQCEKKQQNILIKEIKSLNAQIINESERIMAAVFPCEEFVYDDESGEEK